MKVLCYLLIYGGLTMSVNKKVITWTQFEICNSDKRNAFESMCRLLFKHTYLNNINTYHSNANNPGVEVEPVLTESGKRISFQSKYFEKLDSSCYSQIQHSADRTIKFYSGKLDVLYLYCNLDLTTTSKTYVKTVSDLKNNGIELVLISNNTILDQVIEEPAIASYYFLAHNLDENWFYENITTSLNALGTRYNSKFNVTTSLNQYLDLFSCNDDAIKFLNGKKLEAIRIIKSNCWKYDENRPFIDSLCRFIKNLDNVTVSTISDCFDWSNRIKSEFSNDFARINNQVASKVKELNESESREEKQKIEREICILQELCKFDMVLEFEQIEKNLIRNKMLIVSGNAGTGKSQLFAFNSKKAIQNGLNSILVLGQTFINNQYVESQISSILGINYEFDEFLYIIECLGEIHNQPVVIYIDAVNESNYRDIWKNGLSRIYNKIKNLNYVRLAVSVRSGYESFVFDNNVINLQASQAITNIHHTGFQENSIEAVREFLNFYNIPFYPSFSISYELTNPLFLLLFCKMYKKEYEGNNLFNIYMLFEKLINETNNELLKENNILINKNILINLIYEIIKIEISKNENNISQEDLLRLEFWETFGLNSNKINSIRIIEKSGLLNSFTTNNEARYYLGYNLLEDYLSAKMIVETHTDKSELREYIKNDILGINDGKISKLNNRDLFIAICSLFAEKYNEECIDVAEGLNEHYYVSLLYHSYINSYNLRKANTINYKYFIDFVDKHHIEPKIVFSVLIQNSTKINHPLNAEFLYSILINKSLNERDWMWTTFINDIDASHRVIQLINYFNEGNTLSGLSTDNTFLLLILFTWLLTSSNRYTRDIASKAIIELLKSNFQLCLPLLQKFESVNDPYVFQRLYGVAFGACVKRTFVYENDYKNLAEYVYKNIFFQKEVYPDILLRDYARLIIERYLFEFPNSISIDIDLISPPYNSEAIPTVVKEEYYNNDMLQSGFNIIDCSMIPDTRNTPGLYGDFGRYTFQSALNYFENIDIDNLYHYAMQYIRDVLGYKNSYFTDYDLCSRRAFSDRSNTKKCERIGKKYQWITFYNILARVSDRHMLHNYNEPSSPYIGPWQIHVRDFDPTLNCNFIVSKDLPEFNSDEDYIEDFISDKSDLGVAEKWTKKNCQLFKNHSKKLILRDLSDIQWVKLFSYDKVENKDDNYEGPYFYTGKQDIWLKSDGYFVNKKQFSNIKNAISNHRISGERLSGGFNITSLFLREYPWSISYHTLDNDSWSDYNIYTGEEKEVTYEGEELDYSKLEEGVLQIYKKVCSGKEKIKKSIAKVISSYSNLAWESEYDASQDETTSFLLPCEELIKYLKLNFKEYDGCFYSGETLVSHYISTGRDSFALIFRKEYLDKFIKDNNLVIFWECYGEKQYFYAGHNQYWQEWNGILYLEDNEIKGSIGCKNI